MEHPVPTSPQYGEWARNQRPQGTVYGSRPQPNQPDPNGQPRDVPGQYAPGQYHAGRPAPGQEPYRGGNGPLPLEASGSLTGHILAQGRPDAPDESRSSRKRALVLILVAVGILVLAGLLAAALVVLKVI